MPAAPFLLFAVACGALAQTPLGTVTGLAIDPSGAVAPGAAVKLTSEETGVERTAATNNAGAYSFPDLPPGAYRPAAEAKGFRPFETRAFAVAAYGTVRQDLRLKVAPRAPDNQDCAGVSRSHSPETSLDDLGDHRFNDLQPQG